MGMEKRVAGGTERSVELHVLGANEHSKTRAEQKRRVAGLDLQPTHLVGLEHAVEPRQQLLGTVVGVQHDRDAVELGHLSNVERHGDGPRDGGLFLGLLVVDALAGEEGGTAVGHLIRYVGRTRNAGSNPSLTLGYAIEPPSQCR